MDLSNPCMYSVISRSTASYVSLSFSTVTEAIISSAALNISPSALLVAAARNSSDTELHTEEEVSSSSWDLIL